MKVVVITGSAHRNGTSAYLAQRFIEGASEAGHDIFRFDAAFMNVHPCIGCEKCHRTGVCAFRDDMNKLNPHLFEADAVVFVSPIYYYGMNAQIKAVMDRFYANDDKLHSKKKAVLMLTMADTTTESAEGPLASFKGMTSYLGWDIAGTIVGLNTETTELLKKSPYPEQAYLLGKKL